MKPAVLVVMVAMCVGLLSSPAVGAQQAAWERQFGGGPTHSRYEIVFGTATDSSGNVYVAGLTQASTPTVGSQEGFVRKFDPDGRELWMRQFGATGQFPAVEASDISVAPNGTVVVFGVVTGALSGQTQVGPGGDVFVRTYDADGTELWTRQFGTTRAQFSISGAVGPEGTIYVAGETFGEFTASPNHDRDVFVRGYDPSGNELWTRQIGSIEQDIDAPHAIAADASGLYVTGSTFGTFPGHTKTGDVDGFLVHFDQGGTILWLEQFGAAGLTGLTVPGALAIEPVTHDVYVVENHDTITNPIRSDSLVRRFHPDGSTAFEKQYGNLLQNESISDAATDSEGNLYVIGTGSHSTSLDKDPQQIVVRRLTPEGEGVWRVELGGTGADWGYAVSTDADGNVFAGGIADVGGVPRSSLWGEGYLAKIVQLHSCLGTSFPTGDEDGVLSRPVHESVEPTVNVAGLGFAGHAINCGVIVRVGL